MKKVSFFLMMALITGMLSAFTHATKTSLTDAYAYVDEDWIPVDRSEIGQTFLCNSGGTYCLYNTPNFNDPVTETVGKQFVPIP